MRDDGFILVLTAFAAAFVTSNSFFISREATFSRTFLACENGYSESLLRRTRKRPLGWSPLWIPMHSNDRSMNRMQKRSRNLLKQLKMTKVHESDAYDDYESDNTDTSDWDGNFDNLPDEEFGEYTMDSWGNHIEDEQDLDNFLNSVFDEDDSVDLVDLDTKILQDQIPDFKSIRPAEKEQVASSSPGSQMKDRNFDFIRPLKYLTLDETETMASLMSNFTLTPASQIAYFYLHNTLGVSDEIMWKITLECGSVLGLTTLNLERKVSTLKRFMNLSDQDIREIIEKQPTVLQLNPETNIGPTLSFLVRSLDLTKDELRTIVVKYPSTLCYSIENLKNKITFFLETLGCSKEQARTLLVSTPQLLTLSVSSGTGLMAKYNFFRYDVELSKNCIRNFILANPRILACYSFENNLVPKLIGFFMIRLDMSSTHVEKMLLNYPFVMDRSLEGHLNPCAHYFCDEVGFSPQELRTVVVKFPRILSYSLKKIKHVAGFLRYEVGCSGIQTKRILYQAPQVVCLNNEKLRSKVTYLQKALDLNEFELRKLISGMPSVLKCSIEKNIAPKVEYLSAELGDSLKDIIVLQPSLLGYSLEKRVRTRLEQLKDKGVPLRKITIGITLTDDKFRKWIHSESLSPDEKATMRWKKRRGLLEDFETKPVKTSSGKHVIDKAARIISWTRPVE